MTPRSIKGFLEILRNTPLNVKPTKKQTAIAMRQMIRKGFARRLNNLEYEEVEMRKRLAEHVLCGRVGWGDGPGWSRLGEPQEREHEETHSTWRSAATELLGRGGAAV
jgi:hypothetical protein